MSLGVGARLGHYAVTAKLGQGGMGEVWRATLERGTCVRWLVSDWRHAAALENSTYRRFRRVNSCRTNCYVSH